MAESDLRQVPVHEEEGSGLTLIRIQAMTRMKVIILIGLIVCTFAVTSGLFAGESTEDSVNAAALAPAALPGG